MIDVANIIKRLLIYLSFVSRKVLNEVIGYLEYGWLIKTDRKLKYPPIFIIGAPRTGTTLLYELMVHYFNVAYFPNIAGVFYKCPVIATRIGQKIFNPYISDFSSSYGRTKGMMGPHEAGSIWNRWYPTEQREGYNYSCPDTLNKKTKHLIYQTVKGIESSFDAPVINKNVKHSVRIRSLVDIFPNALFLQMRRDPIKVAVSILHGRRENIEDITQWWSVMPKEIDHLRNSSYIEQVAGQVYFIERNIAEDIKAVGTDKLFSIYYNDLCDKPKAVLNNVAEFIGRYNQRLKTKNSIPSSFKKPNKSKEKVTNKEEYQLKVTLTRYYEEGGNLYRYEEGQ